MQQSQEATLEAAITTLYNATTEQARQQAQGWLHAFSRQPTAWSPTHRVLCYTASPNRGTVCCSSPPPFDEPPPRRWTRRRLLERPPPPEELLLEALLVEEMREGERGRRAGGGGRGRD